MADPDGRDAECSNYDDELLPEDIWLEDGEFDFDWESEEPVSFISRLRSTLEWYSAAVPGTRRYWSRLKESVSGSVEWRLSEFEELASLSVGEKQALQPRIRAIEEKICTLTEADREISEKIISVTVILVAVIGILSPLLANAWWAGGDYLLLTWVLLCGATLIAGSLLGVGVFLLGAGLMGAVPDAALKGFRGASATLMAPALFVPGLAILGFWLARAATALRMGGADAWGLLWAALPLAGLGASVSLAGMVALAAAWHSAFVSRVTRRHTQDLIPHAFLNILQEVESRPKAWESASYRRNLADGLEEVAVLISQRLPRHLGCGDPITDAWIRTMMAEMANHLRWLKTGLLLPEPGARERFIEESAEALVHSANGHWGGLKRRPLDRPAWRQALSQGAARFAVYLRGLAWALGLPLGLWALQRTAYAPSGWAADLVTIGVLLWSAFLVLAVLGRSFSVRAHALSGLEGPPGMGVDLETELEWDTLGMFAEDGGAVFVTLVGSVQERARAELLIDSLRTFGGAMRECPIWVFEADPEGAPCADLAGDGVEVHALEVPESVRANWFAAKVCACARAEEMAGPEVHSLVWLAPDCLVLQPPVLLDLGRDCVAAVRPVHHKNVGLRADEPLDAFWQGVYRAVGVDDIGKTAESFVDGELLRAYYNSHLLAVKPAWGIFRKWFRVFEALVGDQVFQETACLDGAHQVFLHQAALSAVLAQELPPESLRILPPQYSYPYNLHGQVPAERRAQALNDVVCIAYENRPLHPDQVDDIEIHEPLRSWLAVRVERTAADG